MQETIIAQNISQAKPDRLLNTSDKDDCLTCLQFNRLALIFAHFPQAGMVFLNPPKHLLHIRLGEVN